MSKGDARGMPGGARSSQKEPGGVRRSQEEPGGARRSQGKAIPSEIYGKSVTFSSVTLVGPPAGSL